MSPGVSVARSAAVVACVFAMGAPVAGAQAYMEKLGRGTVAVRASETDVYVGWRLLGTDPADIAFNVYRSTDDQAPVKLTPKPILQTTDFVDRTANPARSNSYFVRPVRNGKEGAQGAAFSLPPDAPVRQYIAVPLQTLPGHTPNDASVGDLDGDGEYEIVVKQEMRPRDNARAGPTGESKLEAYKLNGTLLWRINLGPNIREGAHYTQFLVYDLDSDGRAEVACKTADGTVDGTGRVIGDPHADHRNEAGYVLRGPEFLTVFDGSTGAALATTAYVPPRGDVASWGDEVGNRVDRFLAAVAYLDGRRPSLVMARGYYTRAVLAAWDWRGGRLTHRWTFDTREGTANAAYEGEGNHQLAIGDVDLDGRDEIIYGAAAIDDNGKGLYATGLGHGDALHLSDMDPDRPGLEVFQPHESPRKYGPNAIEFRDARDGRLIWGVEGTGDIGRGAAMDIDPRYRGYEMWGSGSTGGLYTAQRSAPDAALGPRGLQISERPPAINFGIWWDADPLRELLDRTTISKWNWTAGAAEPLLSPADVASNNGTKATPALSADILGDWREEVIWRTSDNSGLRIYTTTIPATNRLFTLMHDRQYRLAIAWQNVGYNQPPHPGFYLGNGMSQPPAPKIVTPGAAGR